MNSEMMSFRARLFLGLLGLCVLVFVVNLVRTRKLKEQFALLWLLMAGFLVVTPLGIDIFDDLAHALGVEYPPALLFALALMVFVMIFFQFSLSISRFSEQIKTLTQDLALARERIHRLEKGQGAEGTEGTEGAGD